MPDVWRILINYTKQLENIIKFNSSDEWKASHHDVVDVIIMSLFIYSACPVDALKFTEITTAWEKRNSLAYTKH